ncbi:MAG: HAD family phosphatase [Rhodobacterales bacterium]|nr:HAD family phosphatase [Rhodobacterales bacterium]
MSDTAVVFDLGGVLIDWDPRHLYRKVFRDPARMAWFLDTICTGDWNLRQDGGRPLAEATAGLVAQWPEWEPQIRAYYDRWEEMLGGAFDDTVALLDDLAAAGVPLYALTNWSAETFRRARPRFPFLDTFIDIVVSGEERLVKPDPRIFQVMVRRSGRAPADLVFLDDNPANVEAARATGFTAFRHVDGATSRRHLNEMGIL